MRSAAQGGGSQEPQREAVGTAWGQATRQQSSLNGLRGVGWALPMDIPEDGSKQCGTLPQCIRVTLLICST